MSIRDRFRHSGHVIRVVAILAVGLPIFLVIRHALIPSDFGVYGFYRAGALDDIKAKAPVYGGEDQCVVCHAPVEEIRHASKHAQVHCEACHGPLAKHASGDAPDKPKLPDQRICVVCHTKLAGKPPTFPQVVLADHGGPGPCTACHKPHSPKIVATTRGK